MVSVDDRASLALALGHNSFSAKRQGDTHYAVCHIDEVQLTVDRQPCEGPSPVVQIGP